LRGRGLESTLAITAPSNDITYTANYQASLDSGPLTFHTLTPCRLLDTRLAGQGGPALASGETRTFSARGKCQIPPEASALAVVLTATGATATGHVRVYPSDQLVPSSSSLNFSPGLTRANNGVLRLSASGDFTVRAILDPGSTHLIVDVTGYYR
jgi:hypothetical protein